MAKFNQQYFCKEQVAAGELTEFLNLLMKQSYGQGDDYNDIHIVPADFGSFMLEWIQNPWDKSYGGAFVYRTNEEIEEYEIRKEEVNTPTDDD